MTDFINRLKYKYKNGNLLIKLIFINAVIFFILAIIGVFAKLFNIYQLNLIPFVGVPSDTSLLIRRFWTPLTYMFVHVDFLHILFNMLWLYWFGKISLQYFSGRVLGSLYVLGGLAGALLFIIAFNTIPYYVNMQRDWSVLGISPPLIGASAAVMAIVMGAAFYRPDVHVNLLFLGSIKIVYIAIAVFVLDFLALGNDTNPGGHIAHIGGGLLGYFFAIQYKKGRDITGWMSKIIDWFTNLFKRSRKSKMKVTYRKTESDADYNARKHNEQDEIDIILDKLKQSGYSSLSSDEKKKLFDASKK